jgi:linoleoyl-CoA desaturase
MMYHNDHAISATPKQEKTPHPGAPPLVPKYGKPVLYPELTRRIEQFLKETGQTRFGERKMLPKAVFVISAHFVLYALLLSETITGWWAVLGCVLFALNQAAIGFNVMHDGHHGSFSPKPSRNRAAGYLIAWLGGDGFIWNFRHIGLHHPFTNIHEADSDIDFYPFMRMAPAQPHRWWHRYQHYYAPLLYPLYYPVWIFGYDYQDYFTKSTPSASLPVMTRADHVRFWAFKVGYFLWLFVVPMYFLGVQNVLIGASIVLAVTSVMIVTIFVFGHSSDEQIFPIMAEDGSIEDEWAMHQLRATANFATKNPFWNWYCGGLNFQVEHHLFPWLSHVHYRDVQPIVQQFCREHNIDYNDRPSYWAALKAHWRLLTLLSKA